MLNLNKQFQTSVTSFLGLNLVFFQLSKCQQRQYPSIVNYNNKEMWAFVSRLFKNGRKKNDLYRDHSHLMGQQIERCKGSFIKIDNVYKHEDYRNRRCVIFLFIVFNDCVCDSLIEEGINESYCFLLFKRGLWF